MNKGKESEIDYLFEALFSSQMEKGYLKKLDEDRKDAQKDNNSLKGEEGKEIFSMESLRKIYDSSKMSRRQEFRQRMERAIEYFENQR